MSDGYLYGIASCRTSSELSCAAALENACGFIEALIPQKQRMRRLGRNSLIENIILFPGYLFFRMPMETDIQKDIFSHAHTRPLRDSEGDWQLRGSDLEFAQRFFEFGGLIGLSEASFDENRRIRIRSGFLKGHDGDIIRVNRRAHTAEVRVTMQEKIFTIWLGYEEIESPEQTC